MGVLISRFRKKRTTTDILENLEKKICSIKEFQKITQQKQRKVVGRLVLYSLGIYLIAVIVYYFFFTPASIRENIIYFTPLLIYPIVIVVSKKLLTWYYKRRLEKNEELLSELKSSKKKVLDEVMDKETYKVAKEILEKYAPEQLNKDNKLPLVIKNGTGIVSVKSHMGNQLVPRKKFPSAGNVQASSPELAFQAIPNISFNDHQSQPKLPFVRPILQQSRGPFDKLVDALIGDGPNNRYALICKVCGAHNGMALKHEFEFLAFRCAYCLQYNAARKQKPHSPNLLREDAHISQLACESEGSDIVDGSDSEQGYNILDNSKNENAKSETSQVDSTNKEERENDTVNSENELANNATPTFNMNLLRNALDELECKQRESGNNNDDNNKIRVHDESGSTNSVSSKTEESVERIKMETSLNGTDDLSAMDQDKEPILKVE